jgi:hypothetical protein
MPRSAGLAFRTAASDVENSQGDNHLFNPNPGDMVPVGDYQISGMRWIQWLRKAPAVLTRSRSSSATATVHREGFRRWSDSHANVRARHSW